MTELNTPYAVSLVLLTTVVGILSLFGLRTARGMARSPVQYRQKLTDKDPTHPLATLWIQPGGEESIRSWGIALSRLALVFTLFSFATAGVVSTLIIMDRIGMDRTVSPVVEFLCKFEADLAC